MTSTTKNYVSTLFISLLLGSNLGFAQQQTALNTANPDNAVVAESEKKAQEQTPEELKKMNILFEEYQQQLINGWESKAIFTEGKLIKDQRHLKKNLELFSESDKKIEEYNAILQPLEKKIDTLKEQISYLDEQLGLTQYKISNVTSQIVMTKESITTNMEDIERAALETRNQENILVEYVKLIYTHEKQYYDTQEQQLNDVKLLLADRPISKTITKGEYLNVIEKTGEDILQKLKNTHKILAEKEIDLEQKQGKLQLLNGELKKQQDVLQQEQMAKDQLLTITQGEEQKYKELVAQYEAQKQQSANEIVLLKNSIAVIEKELQALQQNTKNLNQEALKKKAESAATLLEIATQDKKVNKFSFPVTPQKGLSAYFKDANYVKVFGVNHGAIDIPAPQGTEIKTPADGYIYKAKDNGFGYSYIIVAHRGGLTTLYGHVSSILVKEGDLVRQGDIIGLSGGARGTKGAGMMTTGPHLHFEVWKDGTKVDPLIYMNLLELPVDKINISMLPTEQKEVPVE